jgi:hypothetical protein
MAMPAREIMEWLETLPEDAEVGVDEGGLCLQVVGNEETSLEIGGLPEDEDYQGILEARPDGPDFS